jgi:hypothetical protein
MRQWLVVAAAGLVLAGCVRDGRGDLPPAPMPIEADSITYETSPCFGRCPQYAMTVRPDGSGTFNGIRFTAVTGERAFKATPAQYAAFAAKLQPYRPASGEVRYEMGSANCGNAPTDMPSVDVRWTRAIGDSQALHFYYGCRGSNAAMADALGHASELLPIQNLIGERP